MKKILLLSFLLLLSVSAVSRKQPSLIPTPQDINWNKNTATIKSVTIRNQTGEKSEKMKFAIRDLKSIFKKNKVKTKDGQYKISLKIGKVNAPYQKDEAYKLSVKKNGITLTANSNKGIFYGIQTIRQLLVRKKKKTTIALCEITDYPAFKIRGYMHDVGRNFQSIELLKKQINVMAMYKYSVFHWHLTEYHGWRLESKKYPGLQSDKAFKRYKGKFYTQKEFVDMVKYCRMRNIMVIPEFDSPGHSDAFMAGVGVSTMKDPKALKAITELIDEVCSLVPAKHMPYIHVGTDEVRNKRHYVDANYLPALHKCVQKNGRQVIGWSQGMTFKGAKQISQTWAKSRPFRGTPHIDSRSNYVNHLDHLDAPLRVLFQQPCNKPHGDDMNLGGILCYWPDVKTLNEDHSMKNSPVYLTQVAYSEATWTGVKQNKPQYWTSFPAADTEEFKQYQDFEDRLVEHRDRFLKDRPYFFVKTTQIPWKVLGTMPYNEAVKLEKDILNNKKKLPYEWSKDSYRGGTIHIKHFFGFKTPFSIGKGHSAAYAQTYIYSPKNQTVDAWINFNTTSTSDNRAGATVAGQWNKQKACNIWINGKAIAPPKWQTPGRSGKEIPFTDDVYTSREPSQIKLKKGWNRVLLRTGPTWKWSFTFTPIKWNGTIAREVKGLEFAAEPK